MERAAYGWKTRKRQRNGEKWKGTVRNGERELVKEEHEQRETSVRVEEKAGKGPCLRIKMKRNREKGCTRGRDGQRERTRERTEAECTRAKEDGERCAKEKEKHAASSKQKQRTRMHL